MNLSIYFSVLAVILKTLHQCFAQNNGAPMRSHSICGVIGQLVDVNAVFGMPSAKIFLEAPFSDQVCFSAVVT